MTADPDAPKLPSVDPTKVPAYYATGVRIRTNPYDVSLLFSRAIPTGVDDPTDVEQPVCIVSMSPALLMSLHRVCERHVALYQQKHAPLPDLIKLDPLPEPEGGDDE